VDINTSSTVSVGLFTYSVCYRRKETDTNSSQQ